MPLKWKIFLALNFILSIPALVILVLLLFRFANHQVNASYNTSFYIFCVGLLIILCNGFLNIFAIQRFYPDRSMTGFARTLNVLGLAASILVALGMLILFIFGAIEEFSASYKPDNSSGKVALIIIFLAWLAQLTVIIMQVRLPRLISRNNQERIRSMIDSIGQ